MKISYTNHALKKFSDFKVFQIIVTKTQISRAINHPKHESRDNGNEISSSSFDRNHNLRVVHKEENGVIIVITFYICRKGRYGEH
ncbi:hypothetical protein A3A60_04235 [Candidatus Curtissbacteria bacterium RIFCSPLOWO2_01_FULL_42_26]|uniref:DUF4258 domain-containing protein n=1 Tax=Candidatus Curtissbacteria bacterium RIFCSPLOWO2_01_FULL_42_26 TaxID=1797729 RepID=A0A1F5HYU5_9BACT|nr:MAG: hypothetical protein A3A60_04235 [Candidatus Curtissbacteria bacterium RIFCSPLOWO2_01_FULL_42_26]